VDRRVITERVVERIRTLEYLVGGVLECIDAGAVGNACDP
jgi:hypothetical protein